MFYLEMCKSGVRLSSSMRVGYQKTVVAEKEEDRMWMELGGNKSGRFLLEVGHDLGKIIDAEGGDGEEDHGGGCSHERALGSALVEIGLDGKDETDPETGAVADHEADGSEHEGNKPGDVWVVVLDALDLWLVFDNTVSPPWV